MVKWIVVVTGAVIVVASAMIGGYRMHAWAAKHMPRVAAWVPRDCFVLAGFGGGVVVVLSWFN